MGPIFRLSLRQLAGPRRLALIFVLAVLPVALSALVAAIADDNASYEKNYINTLLDGMLVASILPIVTMALATAAFGNEVEDRTLSHLVARPISRLAIVLPKLLASIVIAGPLLVLSGVAATVLGLDVGVQGAAAVGLALFAGLVVYSTIFTWAGLVSTRALAFALVYVFLWEGLISSFLGGVRYLSVRGYTLGIIYGLDDDGFADLGDRVIEFPVAIAGSVAVTIIFFWLTLRRLRRMDVP